MPDEEILCDSCKFFKNKTCPSVPGAKIHQCIDYDPAPEKFVLEEANEK